MSSVAAPPLDAAVKIELRSDIKVEATSITMADVARITSKNSEMKAMVENLKIGMTPRIGYVDRYTRKELVMKLQMYFPALSGATEWSGGPAVNIHSDGQLLLGDRLTTNAREFVLNQLGSQFASVDLRTISVPSEIRVPSGAIRLQARLAGVSRMYSRLPVWVDVYVDDTLYCSRVVAFSVKLTQTVYVAKRDLQAGAQAALTDFDLKVEDVSGAAEKILLVDSFPGSTRMRRPLARGQILMRDQVVSPGAVLHGDSVMLTLAEGGVRIESRAIAQQDGELGQIIKVRPQSGTDTITGRLIAAGVVQAESQ